MTDSISENRRPIGVFDSGVGGLTVVRAVRARLPGEDVVYLGDTARVPYGSKSPRTIERYSLTCQGFLLARSVKLVLIACNTASANALPALRAASPVTVIGAVDPGADSAVAASASGHIVVACGGGGVPIKVGPDGRYEGVEAVIDKDLTSSVLATDIGASLLVILTSVPNVFVGFGTPAQRPLGAVTLEEIERLQGEDHFPAGSMGPKIEAVIRYLRSGGRRALITNPESLPDAIEGRAGTHFVGRI